VSVSKGLPSGEAPKSNEATTKKKESKKEAFHQVFFKLVKNRDCCNIRFKEIPIKINNSLLNKLLFHFTYNNGSFCFVQHQPKTQPTSA
jgi:hypothetical protein